MWTGFRVLLSGALRVVVKALLVWLKSEAAKFTAEYIADAQDIVRSVAINKQMSGREKFDFACDELVKKLKDKGLKYKDHWVHDAVQTAYSALYGELHKEK